MLSSTDDSALITSAGVAFPFRAQRFDDRQPVLAMQHAIDDQNRRRPSAPLASASSTVSDSCTGWPLACSSRRIFLGELALVFDDQNRPAPASASAPFSKRRGGHSFIPNAVRRVDLSDWKDGAMMVR